MSDFLDAIRAHGLIPKKHPVPDDRWYRCGTVAKPKSDRGAYKLAATSRIGWFWDLSVDSAPIRWTPSGRELHSLPAPIDPRIEEARRREDRRRSAQATAAASEYYEKCERLLGGHPYLAAHSLDMTGCFGLKVDRDGWLVIPARRGSQLVSVQRISPEGQKLFWPGASMSGVSYVVDRSSAPVTVLCEGLATGLAIFAAVPTARIVVAFTSGNLKKVAATLPYRGMVAVAADNDHKTAERIGKNPGIMAAEEAAAILGCGVMVPEGIEGTDFADLRAERVAARLAKPVYGRPPSENSIRRSVDAEIVLEVQRRAKMRVMPIEDLADTL